jgi:hypothetical protein
MGQIPIQGDRGSADERRFGVGWLAYCLPEQGIPMLFSNHEQKASLKG